MNKGQIMPREVFRAKETAAGLADITHKRLQDLSQQLHNEIGMVRRDFTFNTGGMGAGENFPQVLDVAKQFSYVPNLKEFHQWAQMQLTTEQTSWLVVSFHSVGNTFLGIIAVSVLLRQENAETLSAAADIFQINYEETYDEALKRFEPWLEQALVRALTIWRRTL